MTFLNLIFKLIGFNYFSSLSSLSPNDRTFPLSAFPRLSIAYFSAIYFSLPPSLTPLLQIPHPFQTVSLTSKHFEVGQDLKVQFLIKKLHSIIVPSFVLQAVFLHGWVWEGSWLGRDLEALSEEKCEGSMREIQWDADKGGLEAVYKIDFIFDVYWTTFCFLPFYLCWKGKQAGPI